MSMARIHKETHLVARIGWLRAAVLGANDGIISTASLIIGVAAAAAAKPDILLAGTAGLVAGAMSMAAGEYVSVSSQSDTEEADLERERRELAAGAERRAQDDDRVRGLRRARDGAGIQRAREQASDAEREASGARSRFVRAGRRPGRRHSTFQNMIFCEFQ